jgi:hypothetical protein
MMTNDSLDEMKKKWPKQWPRLRSKKNSLRTSLAFGLVKSWALLWRSSDHDVIPCYTLEKLSKILTPEED